MNKLAIIICLALIAALFAIPAYAEEVQGLTIDGLPNPIHDMDTWDELSKATPDIALGTAPSGATDVEFAYIDGDPRTAEISFTLDGDLYCYRAAFAETADDMQKIDGMYYEFASVESLSSLNVEDFPCTYYHMTDDSLAMVTWYDPDCKTQYSLSSETAGYPERKILKAYMAIAPTACEDPYWTPAEG